MVSRVKNIPLSYKGESFVLNTRYGEHRLLTIFLDNLVKGGEFWMLRHHALDPVVKNVSPKQERPDCAQDIPNHNNCQSKRHRFKQESSSNGEQ